MLTHHIVEHDGEGKHDEVVEELQGATQGQQPKML
jgi:hypothetical protein